MANDERNEVVTAVLSNIRSLRAYSRDVDLEFLKDALEKLQSVVTEKENEYLLEQKTKEEEKNKIEKVRKFMEELGLNPELLSEISSTDESKETKRTGKAYKPVVPAKYRITTDGKIVEWSGRGKPPLAFKLAFENGHDKEEFLIEKA